MSNLMLNELLDDLRSVKLPSNTRAFVDRCRDSIQSNGDIPLDDKRKIREIGRRYSVQLNELHAARERAKRTNGLRRLGITNKQAQEMIAIRRKAEADARLDTGL